MRIVKSLAAAAVIGLSLMTGAFAHGFKVGSLEIGHPWTRATPPGAAAGGGFMTIKNTGTEPDKLIGGTVTFAAKLEVHEMAVTNGVMTMREVAGGLVIPPGATVELKPGSFHVMFIGLKAPLLEGTPVKAVLTFEKAGTVEVSFNVEKIGAAASGHGAAAGQGAAAGHDHTPPKP